MNKSESKINSSRLLLTKLRGGNYAHAGDEEAIEIVLQKVLSIDPEMAKRPSLDVGSGFGGTANYFHLKGFEDIQGIDLDLAAVEYAKRHYPSIPFTHGNARDVDKVYASNSFSFLYLFNVLYAIEDKAGFLKKLSTITKEGGLLVLFDYSQGKASTASPQVDLANKPMYPIQIDEIKKALNEAGWEVIDVTDMTQKYITWYGKLLEKIDLQAASLRQEFSNEDIAKVQSTFTFLHKQLVNGNMGGVIIYAKKVTKGLHQ